MPNDGAVCFFTLGLGKRKATDICVKAFEMLPRALKKKARYYFAGYWPKGSAFWRHLLKKIERNPRMAYLGVIEDTQEKLALFRQMDALVLASRDDSCGLVALEGAMMAKALVVSENVGSKYLLDSSSGYVVKTEDARSLARAFADIIQNADKLKAMGEAARKKYLETSTIEIYERNVLNMAREKIDEASRAVKVQEGFAQIASRLLESYDESIRAKIAQTSLFGLLKEKARRQEKIVPFARKILAALRYFKRP